MPEAISYYTLIHQSKDLEDIAEDFRDGIWANGDNLEVLEHIWAAGKSFIDTYFWEDEYTCFRPDLPEGLERLEKSLDNVAHYALNLYSDVDSIEPTML